MTTVGPSGGPCLGCGEGRPVPFLDLGDQPRAGWFPMAADPPDPVWPLRAALCPRCGLVQLDAPGPDEIDLPGAPPPTASTSMAAHAREFVADAVARVPLDGAAVVEVASHAGYLQPFFAAAGVATVVLEDEPGRVAALRDRGGTVVAGALEDAAAGRSGLRPHGAALVVDHYLLAHRRAPEAALAGVAALLAPGGTAVVEFDHLLPTVRGLQFDAFRHGHRSYLTLTWLVAAAARVGLRVTGAREQPVYGGALRVYLRPAGPAGKREPDGVAAILAAERTAGLADLASLEAFATRVADLRDATVEALATLAREGRPMLGYGAPARAVTLLNHYRLEPGLLPLTADAAAAKQGRCVPGVRTPIVAPDELRRRRPDDVLILAWDLAPEIVRQLGAAGGWEARHWVPIPALRRADAPVEARR